MLYEVITLRGVPDGALAEGLRDDWTTSETQIEQSLTDRLTDLVFGRTDELVEMSFEMFVDAAQRNNFV